MYTHETQKRVRYGETDKMGYLYYGHYAMYYEIGRVEALRNLDLTYKKMEDEHKIMMPVMSFSTKYLRPAYYDDLLTIKTAVPELPERNIDFKVEIFNEQEDLINIGKVKLAFISIENKGRVQVPEFFIKKLKPFYNE